MVSVRLTPVEDEMLKILSAGSVSKSAWFRLQLVTAARNARMISNDEFERITARQRFIRSPREGIRREKLKAAILEASVRVVTTTEGGGSRKRRRQPTLFDGEN